jgi:hypothetical protein
MKQVILFDSSSESFLRDCLGLDELKQDEKGKMAYYREDENVIEVDNWVDLFAIVDRYDAEDFD